MDNPIYNPTPPTMTPGQSLAPQSDQQGRLLVGTAGGSLADAADVTLANGSVTSVLSADKARITAIIVADPANTVNIRIGTAGNVGAARGVLLQPGQPISLDTSDAIAAYAGAASQKVSILIVRA